MNIKSAACAASLWWIAGVVYGQASPSSQQSSASPSADTSLTEIVVTAQKRDERLVDVPITITTITGAQLEASGVYSTQDLGQVVPALRLDTQSGYQQATIRGVGSETAGPGFNAAVATYVDGIYRPSQYTSNVELNDVSSIQVLKGPQGTLFGRNATGGAIVVTTNDPTFETRGEGSVSYGRFGEVRSSLVASTGLTDEMAFSLAVQDYHTDGFVHNLYNSTIVDAANKLDIRAKLLFQPAAGTSFLLTYEHYSINDGSPAALNAYQGRDIANDPAAVAPLDPSGAPIVIPTQRGTVSLDGPIDFRVNQDVVSLRARSDLGFATLTSYSAYLDEHSWNEEDFDATALPFFSGYYQEPEQTITQELNLTSKLTGPFSWVGGLFYLHDKNYYPFFYGVFNGAPQVDVFNVGVNTASYAAFADGTYDATPKLHFTAGIRYGIDDENEFFAFYPPSNYTYASKRFSETTPRAVVRYNLADATNVYASVSEGYKAGAFNAAGGSTTPVEPEKIIAYEIGLKTASPRWHLETSVYHYDYKDLQVNEFQGIAVTLLNAAKARIDGADLSVTANLTSDFHVLLGAAYTDARYTSFPDAPKYIGNGYPGDPIRTISVNASGFEMARAPRWTGNVALDYEYPLPTGKLKFNASYYVTSMFYFDPAHSGQQGEYGLLNARATYMFPGDRFSVGLYGNNITDRVYITQLLFEPQAALQAFGTPATYGAQISFKF